MTPRKRETEETIRQARKCYGLSQEQLAGKLCVSRSAIAKWETDKGMPDVENLKTLSRLLGVSMDTLLDDTAQTAVVRHPYDLAAYGRGCKKVKKDRMIRKKFPEAKICCLLGRPALLPEDAALDETRGILTPGPFGMPEFIKSFRDSERDFYLVEQEDMLLFVTVTQDFMEIRPLPQAPEEKAIQIGNWTFIRLNYLAEE